MRNQLAPRRWAWGLGTLILWSGLEQVVWASPPSPETPPHDLMWSYLGAGLAWLIPLALVLWVLSGLEEKEARFASLLIPAAVGVTALGYVATGFALEFGGVGLLDPRHGFSQLVWEWSALPEQWGPYWGMAGFSGWFLSQGTGSPEATALFIGHLPWVLTATFIPLLVLRRRVPAAIPLLVAGAMAAFIVPVAGNWTYGGGWLSRLGTTLGWGHGYVDVGGSGIVGLVGGGVGLAMLLAFRLTRTRSSEEIPDLPSVPLPVWGATAVLFLVVGIVGWTTNNPLYPIETWPFHRILANAFLGLAGGMALPALYIWFVADELHPHFPLAGGFAGWLAVLAGLPFLSPLVALGVGVLAGFLAPLIVFLVREQLRLDDPAGLVSSALLGGWLGTLVVGLGADGRYGQGWNAIGHRVYLGVSDQGVSGLWVAPGFVPDWPAQMQAQLAGASAQFVWAFLLGSLLGVGLVLLTWALRRITLSAQPATSPVHPPVPEPDLQEDTPHENDLPLDPAR